MGHIQNRIGAGRQRAAVALLCALLAAACATAPSPREPRIILFPGAGPEPARTQRIASYTQAAAAIAAVFERDLRFKTFPARLQLWSDRGGFETALVKAGYEASFARETARVMAAVGGYRAVLLNEAALMPLAWPERVGLLAHELTHTFQYELGGGQRGASDQWLREGFAEWVAMRVLDRLRFATPADYRRAKLRQLRATSPAKAPRLDEMATFPQLVALAARGDIAPYAQAFLAVDLLIERHGLPAVVRYFELFAASDDRAGNFAAAFGHDVEAIESALLDRVWPRRGRR
jgi:hypothetical protein